MIDAELSTAGCIKISCMVSAWALKFTNDPSHCNAFWRIEQRAFLQKVSAFYSVRVILCYIMSLRCGLEQVLQGCISNSCSSSGWALKFTNDPWHCNAFWRILQRAFLQKVSGFYSVIVMSLRCGLEQGLQGYISISCMASEGALKLTNDPSLSKRQRQWHRHLQKVSALYSVIVMPLRCGSKQGLWFLIFRATFKAIKRKTTFNFMEPEFCTDALWWRIFIDEIINIQFKPVDWPAKSFVARWNIFYIYAHQLQLSDAWWSRGW